MKTSETLILDTIMKGFDDLSVDARGVFRLCAKAGFWLPRSASGDLVRRLSNLIKDGKDDPSEFQTELVNYFEENNWAELKRMVDAWMSNPIFHQRNHIILDCLNAHLKENYSVTIPALLPQLEGLARELAGQQSGDINSFKKAVNENTKNYLSVEGEKETILELMSQPGSFTASAKKDNLTVQGFENWAGKRDLAADQALSRNAILHGSHLHYGTKLNSLKVFLALDLLYWMKVEDWDERLKFLLRLHGAA